jgi:hypothetical protein
VNESSASPAHPSNEETPHACLDGWVYIGYMVESEHDLDGEVVEYIRVPCRRCADEQLALEIIQRGPAHAGEALHAAIFGPDHV